ncbi:MAG TPA: RsmE family RNA methyltransferase [bacterium]|mgnify:CR=1 FL=1|jgi:16S rRNA (uracil1498-N3)-methyltransferase|nr:RsmE family RNA methyltransferase [bacterium]HNT66664.1 RsmE family RNA methyltransferase [bacterium]HOX87218.1 RsmE family RNA methyltransferase [bacterium]HPG46679.1 RsmE family RNA methyltransferase [bacterium]HPM98789.1 RsmE family RNA methyltransferase [bacterium]
MPHLEQYYAAPESINGDRIALLDEEFIHAVRVRRKTIGDRLVVVDGQGCRYSGPIVVLQKHQLQIEIETIAREINEPDLYLTLAHVWPKGQQIDWVIEKGTEIGIRRFLPVMSERSIIDPAARLQRLQKKAIAAMKQCGRCRLPLIDSPIDFAECIDRPDGTPWIAHDVDQPMISTSVLEEMRQNRRATVLVGPEGGFSDDELHRALQAGWNPLRLGDRRLRSETAALVAAVKIFAAIGEI